MRRKRSNYISSRNRGGSKTGLITVLGLIIGAGAYIFTSPNFEREAPVIETTDNLFWNRRDPLEINIKDNLGLKSYSVEISDGKNSIVVVNDMISEPNQKSKTIKVEYPRKAVNGVILDPKSKIFKITVLATDQSKWNFLLGNSISKSSDIEIDYKRPDVNILSNSYSITKGGSALVVFQVRDDRALKEFHLEAGGRKFKATPYKKDGYYAGLVAWPFNQKDFSAKVSAQDYAGNRRVVNIPFYLLHKNYKSSLIQAKDKFIDGKISDLADSDPQYALITDRIKKLKVVNEDMRKANEDLIHKLSKEVSNRMIQTWEIKPFYPLKNAKKVAGYGDDRHYYYKDKNNEVSQSYHVGLDMASTKMAQIISSNAGKVVHANYNGIYGNMPMIDHGMGLYTLYGHCSNVLVQEGEEISAGTAIAKTGISGLALGDHLHFGVLVQGIETRPEEWMDRRWIRDNVNKIFKEADKIIDGK